MTIAPRRRPGRRRRTCPLSARLASTAIDPLSRKPGSKVDGSARGPVQRGRLPRERQVEEHARSRRTWYACVPTDLWYACVPLAQPRPWPRLRGSVDRPCHGVAGRGVPDMCARKDVSNPRRGAAGSTWLVVPETMHSWEISRTICTVTSRTWRDQRSYSPPYAASSMSPDSMTVVHRRSRPNSVRSSGWSGQQSGKGYVLVK